MRGHLMSAEITCVKGCLPCAAPSRATALNFQRRSGSRLNRSSGNGPCHTSGGNGPHWCCCCINNRLSPTARPRHGCSCICVRGNDGVAVGPRGTFPWKTSRDGVARRRFPPLDQALVKAGAGERMAETKPPLSRPSLADVTARARQALGKLISRSTVWRRLDTDAIKPWRDTYWIVPRDPHCIETAGPMLDL
jgi:hypothetical protein